MMACRRRAVPEAVPSTASGHWPCSASWPTTRTTRQPGAAISASTSSSYCPAISSPDCCLQSPHPERPLATYGAFLLRRLVRLTSALAVALVAVVALGLTTGRDADRPVLRSCTAAAAGYVMDLPAAERLQCNAMWHITWSLAVGRPQRWALPPAVRRGGARPGHPAYPRRRTDGPAAPRAVRRRPGAAARLRAGAAPARSAGPHPTGDDRARRDGAAGVLLVLVVVGGRART